MDKAGDETGTQRGRHTGNEAAMQETSQAGNDVGRHVMRWSGSQADTLLGRQERRETCREAGIINSVLFTPQ